MPAPGVAKTTDGKGHGFWTKSLGLNPLSAITWRRDPRASHLSAEPQPPTYKTRVTGDLPCEGAREGTCAIAAVVIIGAVTGIDYEA